MSIFQDSNKEIETDHIPVRKRSCNDMKDLKYNYVKLNYEGVVRKLIDGEENYKKKYKSLNSKKGVSIIAKMFSEMFGVGSGITLTATCVGAVAGVPIIRAT